MKKSSKRILVFMLVLSMILTGSYMPDHIIQLGHVKAATTSEMIYEGTSGTVTRAQWIHNLRVIFEMTGTSDNYPDEYYSDVTADSEYYDDIMLAVEFGVIDLEAGNEFHPDDPASRDFVAYTTNFCMGYQLEEETYSFSDADTLLHPTDDQIAVNRGWFVLISGGYSGESQVTSTEVKTIVADAQKVKASTDVDESYDNQYEYAEGVIEVPQETEVSVDQDKVVTIKDCPVTIQEGDQFVIYLNDLPQSYKASSIEVSDGQTIIVTSETEDAIASMDAQGVMEADLGQAEPADGVDIAYTEETSTTRMAGKNVSAKKASGSKNVKDITLSKKIKLGKGANLVVNCTLSQLLVTYKVNTKGSNKQVYLAADGLADTSTTLNVDGLEAAGIPKSVLLGKIPIKDVGDVSITAELGLNGKVTINYATYFTTGVEWTSNDGFRLVKKFTKKEAGIQSELNMKAGIKVAFDVTSIPLIKGTIYAEMGGKGKITSKTYTDGKKPTTCVHISAYLYAEIGASVSIAIVNRDYGKTLTIFDESNSPVRVCYHIEDGTLVCPCSRNPKGYYYTSIDSRYGSYSGGYGLNDKGEQVPVFTYTVDEDGNATITGYTGYASVLSIPETIDGYTVVAIGKEAFKNKDDITLVNIPSTVFSIGTSAF